MYYNARLKSLQTARLRTNNSFSTARLAAILIRLHIHRYIYYRYLQIPKMVRLPPNNPSKVRSGDLRRAVQTFKYAIII